MTRTLSQAFLDNFLGHAASWYKLTIVGFLILNPILFIAMGPVFTGWVLVGEFIFTLAMALKCYPLQPGGLLAIEAVVIGLTSAESVYHEAAKNFEVIMLLIFMIAGIFFLKDMLMYVFTKILLGIRSKVLLSLTFSFSAAILSAFLDALTVTAVIITVASGFYGVYHKAASGIPHDAEHDFDDEKVKVDHREDLKAFRRFLRNLMMHAAVGTALGGVTTMVGEPQNLLIAEQAGWDFITFFLKMAPVSMPVLLAGLMTCVVVEKMKWFGYGGELPEYVRNILLAYEAEREEERGVADKAIIISQTMVAIFLVIALAFHWAPVGLIGLAVIVLATSFTGVIEEHRLGHAFTEALPFTALLVVFFAIVGVIHDQHLFSPIINAVLSLDKELQVPVFYLANGILSAISDNVFVATIYINEVVDALHAGTIDREHFDMLTIAINTGTNIPSVATPNGQAAFLFLLTSALAPLIRLSYMRMVILAFPYTVVMTITGLLATIFIL
ncbi:MAG: sodium/proton antiporter NhaB [Proteobacteria bacterium]|nr:sodium/proton antiporter NhaB [Pseudomonadota bacterium]